VGQGKVSDVNQETRENFAASQFIRGIKISTGHYIFNIIKPTELAWFGLSCHWMLEDSSDAFI